MSWTLADDNYEDEDNDSNQSGLPENYNDLNVCVCRTQKEPFPVFRLSPVRR